GIVGGGGGVTLEEPPHPSRAIQEVTSSESPMCVLFIVMQPGPSEPGRLAGRRVLAPHEAEARVARAIGRSAGGPDVPLLVEGVCGLDRELLFLDERADALALEFLFDGNPVD